MSVTLLDAALRGTVELAAAAMLVLAIIYWLSLVLVIVAIGLAVAVLIGVWGSLEIQQQVRDILRAVTTPVP